MKMNGKTIATAVGRLRIEEELEEFEMNDVSREGI